MSDDKAASSDAGSDDLKGEDELSYKAPDQKSMIDILKTDAEDESLRRYKEQLLGAAATMGETIFYPDVPGKFILKKISLVAQEHTPIDLDVSGMTHEAMSKLCVVLKEGAKYQIKFYFIIQREIVTGLKYVHGIYKKTGIADVRVDKDEFMMGSYGPQREPHCFSTPEEEAPSGMMARGAYVVKGRFVDDDKHEHFKLQFKLDIKKDWQ